MFLKLSSFQEIAPLILNDYLSQLKLNLAKITAIKAELLPQISSQLYTQLTYSIDHPPLIICGASKHIGVDNSAQIEEQKKRAAAAELQRKSALIAKRTMIPTQAPNLLNQLLTDINQLSQLLDKDNYTEVLSVLTEMLPTGPLNADIAKSKKLSVFEKVQKTADPQEVTELLRTEVKQQRIQIACLLKLLEMSAQDEATTEIRMSAIEAQLSEEQKRSKELLAEILKQKEFNKKTQAQTAELINLIDQDNTIHSEYINAETAVAIYTKMKECESNSVEALVDDIYNLVNPEAQAKKAIVQILKGLNKLYFKAFSSNPEMMTKVTEFVFCILRQFQ